MNYAKPLEVKEILKNALKEDIGSCDITTEIFIPKDKLVKAVLLAKQDCVVCGLGVAASLMKIKDKRIKFSPQVKDGMLVKKGRVIARIYGKARSILSAERVVLNFLTHLSGISTQTRAFVDKIKPYKARILDTRKTTPCLRLLEKYAVRIGGGFNHRLRLDEMILIKDNHLQVAGHKLWISGLKNIKNRARYRYKIEVEVKNLRDFKKALEIRPDIIMLDNMSLKETKKAVKMRNSLSPTNLHPSPKLEVSGRVSLDQVRSIASTGVEMISIGALTHSAPSADISLELL